MSLICKWMKCHVKEWAPRLAFRKTLKVIRKWPIETERDWREPLSTRKHIKRGLQQVYDNYTLVIPDISEHSARGYSTQSYLTSVLHWKEKEVFQYWSIGTKRSQTQGQKQKCCVINGPSSSSGAICGLSLSLSFVNWLSALLRGVLLWVLRFSSLHKNQHLQIPIRPG